MEQRAHAWLGCRLVAPTLDAQVQAGGGLLHRAPPVRARAVNRSTSRLQVPGLPGLRALATPALGRLLPPLPPPVTDGFMGHRDAALAQECFPSAVAQGEAIREPDSLADDLAGAAVVLIAFRVSGWRQVRGLSYGWLGL